MSLRANLKSGKVSRPPPRANCARSLAITLTSLCLGFEVHAASLQDIFANRETVTNASGQITGDNSTATVEAGEPQHGNKPGGHSVWLSWVAPTNGIATFRTDGSSFDTLLSAYYFGSTNDTTLNQLHQAAGDDDSAGSQPASLIQFGAQAGQRYEIAVDGYYGAVGPIVLQWSFLNITSPPPVIVGLPADQSGRSGDPVSLTVNLENSSETEFEWEQDENELHETSTNLFISTLQVTNVGRYSLRLSVGGVRFFTTPVELQINSEGAVNTLARDKLFDAPGSALVGSAGQGGSRSSARIRPLGTGVVRGYNGSQVFDTTYATLDPQEPPHCGVSGGASYWLAYNPPANGTITLDTIGSAFPTVLEAYTYNGTLSSYSDLISLACDKNSISPGGAARISVPVLKTRQYLVVVDGVNGARGTAWLNYNLDTNNPPIAPTLLSPTTKSVVVPGASVILAPSLAGSVPLRFSWTKNQTPMPSANSPSLALTNVTTADSADYILTVTNDLGRLAVTSTLHVVVPSACAISPTPTGMSLSWPTVSGQLYTIEQASSLDGPWSAWSNAFLGNGQTTNVDLAATGTVFYRVRIE